MSKTKKGSNAQFTSAGKGLTVIGNHCYGYSGDTPIPQGTTVTFFDFTTGKHYIKGLIQVGRNVKTSAEHEHKLYINGILVWYSKMDNSATVTNQTPNSDPLYVIIPPLSKVELTITSSDAVTSQKTATFIGKVYSG